MTIAAAGIVASVALAKGGVVVKVPAPAVGKASIQQVIIKITGPKQGRPTLTLTNNAALGKGFGGAAVVGKLRKQTGKTTTYVALIVMFMGNLSTSPASFASIQVTPPAGDTASTSKPTNESTNCPVVHQAEHPRAEGYGWAQWFLTAIGENESPPRVFVDNVSSLFHCN